MVDQIRERKWPIAVAALSGLLVLLVVVGETGGGQDPDGAVRADARRVHCLSAKQRPMLVETAIRLDEAAPGSTETAFWPGPTRRGAEPTTLDQWSRDSGGAFTRTCKPLAALTGAKALQDPAPKPPLWQRIATNPVFTLVLGALLTLATTLLTAHNAHRQALSDRLSASATEYLKAAQAMRIARAGKKAADEPGLEGRRLDLVSAILLAGLPAADQRSLDGLLGRAHRKLVGPGFESASTQTELWLLEAALAKAIRGEPVPSAETTGTDGESAGRTERGRT